MLDLVIIAFSLQTTGGRFCEDGSQYWLCLIHYTIAHSGILHPWLGIEDWPAVVGFTCRLISRTTFISTESTQKTKRSAYKHYYMTIIPITAYQFLKIADINNKNPRHSAVRLCRLPRILRLQTGQLVCFMLERWRLDAKTMSTDVVGTPTKLCRCLKIDRCFGVISEAAT